MTKRLLGIICLSLFTAYLSAQEQTTENIKKDFLKLGIIGKVNTQGQEAPSYTNSLSLNLIYGKSYNENGFLFSGIFSSVRNEAKGFQLSGLATRIHRHGSGVSIAGLYNRSHYYDGLSISAINFSRHSHRGVQIGIYNLAQENMQGVQIGGFNTTKHQQGLQLGLINQRSEGKGLQLGLLNIAQENDYQLGWVNITKSGHKSLGLRFDRLGNLLTTFRSGGRLFYGIIGAGYNVRSSEHMLVVEGGWGVHLRFCKRFRIDNEIALTYMGKTHLASPRLRLGLSLNPFTPYDKDYNYKHIFNPSLRVLPTLRLSNRIEIYAGPTLSYMLAHDEAHKTLFPHFYLWQDLDGPSYKQLYMGYTAGVQYCF
ncbi:LA_2272 family surface repeat-containing protein [Dysgonomonas sp. 25]|uniref:LA_2272 family surface repeat-containing protein n=1 Tax=Dysgonomonas sp. 25 TaxID=2302933 RepID=UPI0013D63905|nr:hypothetical protein [Dysgonomonas sp. 25]NDV68982.1 hypothetical protein [Dysgonomonas sp. 25]